jgi:hypothetical protein
MIMPNNAKKKNFPEDAASDPQTGMEAGADIGMDDFDFGSLDDLATMMVEALTIPLPTDFRDAEPADGDNGATLKNGTLQTGAAKTDTPKTDTPKTGASKTGATKTGAPKTGTLQPPSSKRIN